MVTPRVAGDARVEDWGRQVADATTGWGRHMKMGTLKNEDAHLGGHQVNLYSRSKDANATGSRRRCRNRVLPQRIWEPAMVWERDRKLVLWRPRPHVAFLASLRLWLATALPTSCGVRALLWCPFLWRPLFRMAAAIACGFPFPVAVCLHICDREPLAFRAGWPSLEPLKMEPNVSGV